MTDFSARRVLIFIVAYNAEKTIEAVVDRIPEELRLANFEVLIIDDASKDTTFRKALRRETALGEMRITVLRTPCNQGYGGNQKLGYRYAIEGGFDIVALVHGDGQYAPEKLPELLGPLFAGEADAVFGSRMLCKADALKGGMPFYKWVGNQTLTRLQNRLLGTRLSEFHSGYRLYSTRALAAVPFERNDDGFSFDSDIIVQLHFAGMRIRELPIPTFYGDEVCHVNGVRYAWQVVRTCVRARWHRAHLFYDRKFDVGQGEHAYDLKLGFASSHTFALKAVEAGGRVLELGCGSGELAREMARTAKEVVGVDLVAPEDVGQKLRFYACDLNRGEFPVNVGEFDQVFLLDVVEHLKDPEVFMERLRLAVGLARPELILTTANVAFVVTRGMLLLGQFNYGRKGILDRTHTRLFTFGSLRELLVQCGYEVVETRGIPAPFPKALGAGWFARLLVWINRCLIALVPGLFSYQIFVRARVRPSVESLLKATLQSSAELRRSPGE